LRAASTNKVRNFKFNRDIRILLIITNRMVYICYIKYRDNVVICVLAVGDDELTVGDDDDASSGAAEGGARAGRLGEVTRIGLESKELERDT
jgi:hypothetical protein